MEICYKNYVFDKFVHQLLYDNILKYLYTIFDGYIILLYLILICLVYIFNLLELVILSKIH